MILNGEEALSLSKNCVQIKGGLFAGIILCVKVGLDNLQPALCLKMNEVAWNE